MSDTKMLYLLRHAKSSWGHSDLSDFDRPLNKRGRHDAPEMGRRLRKRGTLPEIIVCSPATRAFETAQLLDLGIEPLVFDETIYEASVGSLLTVIHSLDDRYGSAMLIGHNPAMTWLASELTGADIDPLSTCAVATIRLTTGHWSQTGACLARLLDLDYPKKTL